MEDILSLTPKAYNKEKIDTYKKYICTRRLGQKQKCFKKNSNFRVNGYEEKRLLGHALGCLTGKLHLEYLMKLSPFFSSHLY